MTSLIAELRRRNVLKVAAAYALVSWILIEAGSVLLPTFGAPEWVFKVYVLIVGAGFLVALVIAWIFEVTPEGVKLEKDVDRSASITEQTGQKLNFGLIGLLAVALAVSVTLNITGLRKSEVNTGRSIAVLPFTSRSTDPENLLFTDGIHDDLLISLANIQALKVISRTSVLEYRDTTKNLRDIASELGVDTVLEGAVQRAGNAVRISVQLIDADSDKHLWAKRYDRELTAKNIFAIQTEISEEIAAALRTQLTPEEQGRLASVPTENLEAYSLQAAGRNNLYKRRLETLNLARSQFEQAIALDPEYAQAYSGLADSLLLLSINHQSLPRDEVYRQAQVALDKALELDPSSADAYASLGLLKLDIWQQTRSGPEFDEAEAAFRRAIEISPNHARALMWYAGLVGQAGRDEESIELYRKSLELDPLGRIARSNLAQAYAQIGRSDEALDEWLASVRINPDWPTSYDNISIHLSALGRLDEAVAWAQRAQELSSDPLSGQAGIGVLLAFGETEDAAKSLDRIPASHPLAPIAAGFQMLFRGDRAGAMQSWESAMDVVHAAGQFIYDPISDTAALLEDYEKSLKYCLLLNPELAEPEPDITRFNAHNAIKYAFLLQQQGDNDRANMILAAVGPAIADMPRLGNGGHGLLDVHVLALQGKNEEALARLRQAFQEGLRSARIFDNWSLEETPYYAAIKDTAEFQSLRADMAAAVDVMHRRYLKAKAAGDFEPLRQLAMNRKETI